MNFGGVMKIFAGSFLSPLVHIARWAHMHRFLPVCLSVTFLKIHTSESIIGRSLTDYTLRKKSFKQLGKVLFAVTGRAHCQRQVAFFLSVLQFM